MKEKTIPVEIKDRLSYNPDTGVFTWLGFNKHHPRLTNKRAGCISCDYEVIKVKGVAFKSHRLAWYFMTGEQPNVIDHINGNKIDNRFCNLRNTNPTVNSQNHKEKTKENGLPTGVSFSGSGYRARIQVNKRKLFLGVFDTVEGAKNSYREARDLYHNCPVIKGKDNDNY